MSIYDPALSTAAGNDPFRDYGSDDPAAAADEPTFSPADPAAPSSPVDSFDDITTSTGDDGPSTNPPDNGGYTNPPRRPDRTGSGSSSSGSDPVSSGELDPAVGGDEPTFSTEDPLVGIGEQIEDATSGGGKLNDSGERERKQ